MEFVIIFAVALFLPLIGLLIGKKKITLKEYGLQILASVVVCVLVSATCIFFPSFDKEIWSGEVTNKYSEKVHCRHDYSCNCRSVASGKDSKGHTTYTTKCDTCYEHSYDVDWIVESNLNDTTYIDTIDRRGLKEPPRWSAVKVGDPYSIEKVFMNPLLSNNQTIMKDIPDSSNKYLPIVPEYPEVYDYYKYNRVISIGSPPVNSVEINQSLNEKMRVWGPKKQANVIAVFVSNKITEDFFYALRAKWVDGKKNDAVVVTQILPDGTVGWVRVMSRSENKQFDYQIKFDVDAMHLYDKDKFVAIVDNAVMKSFKRENFKEKYSYLNYEYQISTLQLLVILFIMFAANLGMSIYFYKTDDFE